MPPAQSEIYEGPKNEWLRDVLEQLPNLQSLIVSRLPFFDHAALLALRQPSTHHEPLEADEQSQNLLGGDRVPHRSLSVSQCRSSNGISIFPLRLLIATHCANTTSTGLAEALSHWTNLVFLDLSETLAVRDYTVLSSFRYMPGLQILKLRRMNLRDEDIDVLAEAIGIRVRSLDVRDNKITDTSIRKLLSICFPSAQGPVASQGSVSTTLAVVPDEDWPSGVRKPIFYLMDEFRGDDIDKRFVKRLTRGVVSRLPSEDLPAVGLTHLYIANNYITVEGIASLIKSGNLNVLDVGAVDTAKALVRPRVRSTSSRQLEFSRSLPGAEKLAPIFGHYAAKNLTYLRINHAVVTEKPPVNSDHSSWALNGVNAGKHELVAEGAPNHELEADSRQELPTEEAPCYELEATPPVYEMGDSNGIPRFELPGDPIHFVVSQAVGKKPSSTLEEHTSLDVRRGPIYAPEVVNVHEGRKAEESSSILYDTMGLGKIVHAANGLFVEEQERTGGMTAPSQRETINTRVIHEDSRQTLTSVKERRRKLRSGGDDKPRGLSPGDLPALRSLILTDIPSMDTHQHVVNALKKFLQECAEEAKLAELQASIEQETRYSSGSSRSVYQYYRPRELFALQSLVLEVAVPKHDKASSCRSMTPPNPLPRSLIDHSRSSTEDADTEAFWAAQENDFSFFGEEECGLPAEEPGMHFPLSALSEKVVMPMDSLYPGDLPTLQQPRKEQASIDVVQELAKFRRERKAAYERALALGEKYVDGHWPGEVKIIRNKAGNSHQNGWNYFSNDVA